MGIALVKKNYPYITVSNFKRGKRDNHVLETERTKLTVTYYCEKRVMT